MNFLQNEIIKVIDNFLPIENQNIIENTLFDNYFPWYRGATTSVEHSTFKSKNIFDYPQMCHVFYAFRNKISTVESDFADIINKNLLNEICNYFNLSELKVMRVKANLQHQHKKSTKNTFNNPHTDSSINHISGIYYVNDSDGPTYFFDEKFKIFNKVNPKKGRMVFFKGDILHSGGHPIKNEVRAVINCNFPII